jgi:hypothetical protein
MTWVRIDDGFADHPKVVKIGTVALAIHVWAICHCARHLTDGRIAHEDLAGCPWVFKRSALRRAIGRLEGTGLWDACEGGWQVHDYLDYNPDAASVREERRRAAERQRRWRERQKQRRNGVTRAVTDKGRNASPDPTPKAWGGRRRLWRARRLLPERSASRAKARAWSSSSHSPANGGARDASPTTADRTGSTRTTPRTVTTLVMKQRRERPPPHPRGRADASRSGARRAGGPGPSHRAVQDEGGRDPHARTCARRSRLHLARDVAHG